MDAPKPPGPVAPARWSSGYDSMMTICVFQCQPQRETYFAYTWFLSLEHTLSRDSLPQYLSAIFKPHELHHLQSPPKATLICALVRVFMRQFDNTAALSLLRTGCPATVMIKIVNIGQGASNFVDLPCYSAVILAFIFQLPSSTVSTCERRKLVFKSYGRTATFHIIKRKSIRSPLILCYPDAADWSNSNPLSLLHYWEVANPNPVTRFALSIANSLKQALHLSKINTPGPCTYQYHNPGLVGEMN